MTPKDIRASVLAAITRVAPEVDPATLSGNERLRQQVDMDSIDFLNLIIDLHQELGVDIPETDYHRVTTLDDMVAYVTERVNRGESGSIGA